MNPQQPITTADVAEQARVNTLNNSQRSRRANDSTYVREWRNYRAWVTLKRAQNLIPYGLKYITRENIDLYFSEVVAHRRINPDSARRVVSSLQRYADDEEYCDGSETFRIESPSVKRALETHSSDFHKRQQLVAEDPHNNLPTDILSEETEIRMLSFAAESANWKDMMLCWTACEQMHLRNHSVRKFALPHLRFGATHGPNKRQENPDDDNYGAGWGMTDFGMMSYILDKHVHKTRDRRKRVTGAWHHRHHPRCSSGNLAMNLFCRLYSDYDLNFYSAEPLDDNAPADAPEPVPMWWERKLIVEWSNEKAVHNALMLCAIAQVSNGPRKHTCAKWAWRWDLLWAN